MVGGPPLLHRRHAAGGRRARRRHRRADVGARLRTKARAAQAAPRQLSGRGLAYWTDGKEERILYVTPGYRLVALDAKTGQSRGGLRPQRHRRSQAGPRHRSSISSTRRSGLHATPIVAGNVVIVGAAFETGANPRSRAQRQGRVRGLRRAHRQAAVDLPHHPAGRASSATRRGRTTRGPTPATPGVWAQISVDEELGMAYLPVELPTHDYYGGARPGNNLFAESLVAVDLQDRRAQVALPARAPRHLGHGHPVRADPRRHRGQRPARIKAVAQPTKQAFLYVFDRVTGAADLADRGAAGAAGRRARREVLADAALPHQAAGLRPAGASPSTT